MMILEILKNQYLSIFFGGFAGIVTAWLTQRVLNRRGIFSYYVNHNKVGMSAEDAVFGNVSVMWNNNPVRHLYLSTIELKNESHNDYENVAIKIYTNDTSLLSESTQITDTPDIIEWTESFRNQLHVGLEEEPTENQRTIYSSQREYLIPVFNRCQTVKISYLNSAKTDDMPSIWLSATIKGVKVKFRVPQIQIFGVPQPQAVLVGAVLGLVGLVPLVLFVSNSWIVGIISIMYGFFVVVPGAYSIKLFSKIKDIIGG